jgi:hypothetical protein
MRSVHCVQARRFGLRTERLPEHRHGAVEAPAARIGEQAGQGLGATEALRNSLPAGITPSWWSLYSGTRESLLQ